jgi:internalin A
LDFVNLDHNGISGLEPLTALPNLRGLDLGYNTLTNLTELNTLTNLQRLYLSGNSLSNLVELAQLRKLTSLTLYNNQITDLSPLAGLTNLTDLGLSKNPIGDYSVLIGLTNLTSLWLGDNAISNLNFCSNLKKLEVLDLSDGRLIELDGLENLTNLMVVFVDDNHLTDISGIQDLPNLSYVSLLGNMLDLDAGSPDALVIEDLLNRNVTVIYESQNQSPAISVASQWVIAVNAASTLSLYIDDDSTPSSDLIVVAHSSNAVLLPDQNISIVGTGNIRKMDLAPRANQTGTTEITLSVTDETGASNSAVVQVMVVVAQVVTIPDPNLEATIRQTLNKPIGALDNLDFLELRHLEILDANITNLSGLEWAENLSSLIINSTFPLSLSPLVDLPNLIGLRLQSVPVPDLWRLSQMPQLAFLELNHIPILDLTSLSGLTNLRALSLSQNLLTNIAPLLELPQLAYVDVTLNLLDLSVGSSATEVIEDLQNQGVIVKYFPQYEPPTTPSTALSWLEPVGVPANGQFQLILHLVVPKVYLLQASTNLSYWFPLSIVVATNSDIPIVDDTANSRQRLYRLKELSP